MRGSGEREEEQLGDLEQPKRAPHRGNTISGVQQGSNPAPQLTTCDQEGGPNLRFVCEK